MFKQGGEVNSPGGENAHFLFTSLSFPLFGKTPKTQGS